MVSTTSTMLNASSRVLREPKRQLVFAAFSIAAGVVVIASFPAPL